MKIKIVRTVAFYLCAIIVFYYIHLRSGFFIAFTFLGTMLLVSTVHLWIEIVNLTNKIMGNDNYLANGNFDFGHVIKFLKEGKACRRSGWNGKGLFIVRQVPSHITGEIIPNMQSLPQSAKDILMSRENPRIDYTNQMLIIYPDGRADSWVPSSSDVFAEDWEVIDE